MASVRKYLIGPVTVSKHSGGRLHPRIRVPSQRHFPERVAYNPGSRACEVRLKSNTKHRPGPPVVSDESGPRYSAVYAKFLYVLTLVSKFIIPR